MELSSATAWWLGAAVLVAAELATGTFYLLMLALGAAAAALSAHGGAGVSLQLLAAALVGGGAVALWHLRRSRAPRGSDAAHNRDVNLDIGSPVHVAHWQHDGHARVHYRGADWDARHAGTGPPEAGEHRILAIEGSCLLLERAPR